MFTSKSRTILKKFKALAFLISFLTFISWSIHSNSQTSSQHANDSLSTQDTYYKDYYLERRVLTGNDITVEIHNIFQSIDDSYTIESQWISWVEHLMKRGADTVREAITENLLKRHELMEELIRRRTPKKLEKLAGSWLKPHNDIITRDILRKIFPKELAGSWELRSTSTQILRGRLGLGLINVNNSQWPGPEPIPISRIVDDLRSLLDQRKDTNFRVQMEELIERGSFDVEKLTEQNIQRDDISLAEHLSQKENSLKFINSLVSSKSLCHYVHFFLAKEILIDKSIMEKFSSHFDVWVTKVLMRRLRFKGFYTFFENPMLDLLAKDFVILKHALLWESWIKELIRIRDYDFQRTLWKKVLSREMAMKHPQWEKLVRALDESLLKDESIQKLLLKYKAAQVAAPTKQEEKPNTTPSSENDSNSCKSLF